MKMSLLRRSSLLGALPALVSLLASLDGRAQANLPIYTNDLVNSFQDWSWAPHNLSNTAPVHSGTYSISVNATSGQAVWLYHENFNTTLYTNLSFWINGGPGGGQQVNIVGTVNGNSTTSFPLSKLPVNLWQQYTVPLANLGVAGNSNCTGFWFQLNSGTTSTFYVDDVQLTARAAPALTHINVNAAQPIRTADARWFGVNTADWDSYLDTAETVSLLQQAGLGTLRFPGGSESDDYHWLSNTTDSNTWTWSTSFSHFAHLATNIGAQTFITVNYGTGTPAEAAAWVRNSNVTNRYGFKYWEIGNECYGTWETDSNSAPHDPYTYATRAASYLQQMKAADPTIKVGAVVINGEDANANGYTNHPATNLVNHSVHTGWTPVVLTTLRNLGVTPDFAIFHWYPEYVQDGDPLLLQGTSSWSTNAANLRLMITDYFGPGGTNIELVCTENNADAGTPGKQLVSLVNGIYYADSLAQLMQTEFNSYLWWDLRNGVDTTGDMDPTIYGWRLYGDEGLINGSGSVISNRYPQYYTAKLMQYFVRGGDTVLAASSDYSLLSAYSARRADGKLTVLVINKDSVGNFTAQIALNGYVPSAGATIYSYGMAQDNAAQTGIGSTDIAQTNFPGAATSFTYTFAPYSATVFSFAPSPPSLLAMAAGQSNQFILQIQGQPGVPYVLQSSTDLALWTPVATNLLTSATLNLTNTILPGAAAQFWRALWQP